MKKQKGLKITALIILVISLIYILLPAYLKTALVHLKANIDDYQIFQNRFVLTNTHQPWLLANDYNTHKIDEEHIKTMENLETIAFLVVQDKKIKHEQYWGAYDQNSYTNSFSMSKSIVSLLVGIAIDEGVIQSVNDAVGNYLPNFMEDTKAKLTIEDLLTMSSGLDWDESYASPFSKTTQAYYGNNLKDLMLNLDIIEEPGKTFKYYSSSTQLLAFILEAATGKKISQYASEKLWMPLGAKQNALWSLDHSDGDEKAYCCFNSNARDFARLGQLVLDNGNWNNQQLVSESYLQKMTTPASHLVDNAGNPVDFYGYQIWILEYENMKIPYFRGILGQYIFIIPEKNMVVVRLGEKRSKQKNGKHPKDAFTYLNAAMNIIETK